MKRFLAWAVAIFLIVFPMSAFGSISFSTIVAFGDSLTDNGKSPPDDNHGIQYFTDGAVWVESLAATMGSTLYDVAYGGATTGYDNPAASLPFTGLLWQVDYAIPSGVGGDGTLFSVLAGANDFFQARGFSEAVTNIATALTKLAAGGASSILVANLPDLGLTPAFYGDVNPKATQAQATGWAQAFNGLLLGSLQTFAVQNPTVDIYFMDIDRLFSDFMIMANGEINPVLWDLMFWDAVHPTSLGHALAAGEAYSVLQAGPLVVPVPAAVWLLGSGLLGLVGARRLRRNGQ